MLLQFEGIDVNQGNVRIIISTSSTMFHLHSLPLITIIFGIKYLFLFPLQEEWDTPLLAAVLGHTKMLSDEVRFTIRYRFHAYFH